MGINANPIVTILNVEPVEREGEFKGRDGEAISYSTRKQAAKVEVGGFAYPYEVRLEAGQKPYPLGQYDMDLSAMLEINKKAHGIAKYPVLVARK